MSVLHTVSQSPGMGSALASCIRLSAAGSAILLTEDAVIAALAGGAAEDAVTAVLDTRRVFALTPDLKARGLEAGRIIDGVELVDHAGFVDLCTEYSKVLAWY